LLHQVVENLSELSQHINLKEGSIKLRLLQLFLRNFYIFVLLTANKVVVHDEILKQRLIRMRKREVHVIPHGQGEYKDVCAIINARQHLNIPKNDFVILCFGFVTWYKGTDWIVKKFLEFYKLNPELTNVRLILAGGESANLRDKPHYQRFYADVVANAKKSPYILHTGFVSDQDVPYYFCASDVAVLPYRTQMSASGPLAIALSFNRPFLLSESIKGLLETFDIKDEMAKLQLKSDDILFNMNNNSLFEKIYNLVSNKGELELLSRLSSAIREKRDWKVTSSMFIEVIDAKS
jgi:glycosyltransferase involved in cell wall biosynthesis